MPPGAIDGVGRHFVTFLISSLAIIDKCSGHSRRKIVQHRSSVYCVQY